MLRILERQAPLLSPDAPTQIALSDQTKDSLTDTSAELKRLLLGDTEPLL